MAIKGAAGRKKHEDSCGGKLWKRDQTKPSRSLLHTNGAAQARREMKDQPPSPPNRLLALPVCDASGAPIQAILPMKARFTCFAVAVLVALSTVFFSTRSFAADPKVSTSAVDLLEGGVLTKNWTTTGNWKLGPDGAVTLTPRPGEQGWTRWTAYLWSNKSYGDFEIEFEYTVQKNGNSGFYFRVGDVNDPVEKGIEVQIYDSASEPADKPLNDHDSKDESAFTHGTHVDRCRTATARARPLAEGGALCAGCGAAHLHRHRSLAQAVGGGDPGNSHGPVECLRP